ncbi:alpha-amylase [Deminuibacter soli]|uniref:Alpha-amylase n=2 Tax=Deminuibacter soli TaxID=2291815 RepID=A0A3E1NJQ1_9BACT|nr:alpha-amylase [Deminuibacter soli]
MIGCLLQLHVAAQSAYATVYPGNWWAGMQYNKLQLLIKGGYDGFSSETVRINYPGITLTGVHKVQNGKYLLADISITAAAKPGIPAIEFISNGKAHAVQWPLKPRRKGNGTSYAKGVTSADFIYLLMPDRFSNGDTANDRVPGMRDQSLNRDSIFLRHGGDLQGVINHLDYLQQLGVTTVWMTPVIENDMPNRTEHGYAFTNHYSIEPRLGGADAYLRLSDSLHARGMKLIQDAVYNHVGLYHFLVQDPPAPDWLHQWPKYTQTSFKDQPVFDPHGAAADKKITTDGWFTPEMPDLNQQNPYVANFLIQHAIWSVEQFGVDGWRIDTYIYNDLPFMNRCNQALIKEYPRMTMFGEAWVGSTANQAYFAANTIQTPFKSNLQGVVDFQCNFNGINAALAGDATDGVFKLYNTLSNDFLYVNPMRNVVFLDNHDMSRFYSQVKENVARQKAGIGWLLTARGIPQMYYGTEILMKGISNPDGWVRLDFPGGFPGDARSAFTGAGLSDDEKAVQQYTRTLANYRKNSPALTNGQLMQYLPDNGLYVYFRYTSTQTIMCILNATDQTRSFAFADYAERTKGFTKVKDVLNNNLFNMQPTNDIPAQTILIYELQR